MGHWLRKWMCGGHPRVLAFVGGGHHLPLDSHSECGLFPNTESGLGKVTGLGHRASAEKLEAYVRSPWWHGEFAELVSWVCSTEAFASAQRVISPEEFSGRQVIRSLL